MKINIQDLEMSSHAKVEVALAEILSYLSIAQSMNATGISRSDVLGFENSFDTDVITSVLSSGGFSSQKSYVGMEVAMEGIATLMQDADRVVISESMDYFQAYIASMDKAALSLRDVPEVTPTKNGDPRDRLDAYMRLFKSDWFRVLENNPNVSARMRVLNDTSELLTEIIKLGFKEIIEGKADTFKFITSTKEQNQTQLEESFNTAYAAFTRGLIDITDVLSIGLTDNQTRPTGRIECSLEEPLNGLQQVAWLRKELENIAVLKSTVSDPIEELPLVELGTLPTEADIESFMDKSDAFIVEFKTLLKETKPSLMSETKKVIRKKGTGDMDTRAVITDLLHENTLYSNEMLKVMKVAFEYVGLLHEFKTIFLSDVYKLVKISKVI